MDVAGTFCVNFLLSTILCGEIRQTLSRWSAIGQFTSCPSGRFRETVFRSSAPPQ